MLKNKNKFKRLYKYVIPIGLLSIASIGLSIGLTSCSNVFNPGNVQGNLPNNNKPQDDNNINNSIDYSSFVSIDKSYQQTLTELNNAYNQNFVEASDTYQWPPWNSWYPNNLLGLQKYEWNTWTNWLNENNVNYLAVGYGLIWGLNHVIDRLCYLGLAKTSLGFYQWLTTNSNPVNNEALMVVPKPQSNMSYFLLIKQSWDSFTLKNKIDVQQAFKQYQDQCFKGGISEDNTTNSFQIYAEILNNSLQINIHLMTSKVPSGFFDGQNKDIDFWNYFNNKNEAPNPEEITKKEQQIQEGYQKGLDETNWILNTFLNPIPIPNK